MKKIMFIFAVLVFLSSCSKEPTYIKEEFTMYDSFDTIINFSTYTKKEDDFEKYQKILKEDFIKYHQLFDPYHTYPKLNNLKTINDAAGKMPVKVSDEMIELLSRTRHLNQTFGPEVNICQGQTIELWKKYREESIKTKKAKIPTSKEIKETLQHSNPKDLIIDSKNKTVFIKDPKMRIDLGSVAKGYATEKIAKKLQKEKLPAGIINAGGNVRTIGDPKITGRNQWALGIQNPSALNSKEQANQILAIYHTKGTSLVTSGDYQRYFIYQGKKYHHIIDPKTGNPSRHFKSVTIATKDSMLADFLSTDLFVKNYEEGLKLVEKTKGVDALWVFEDGHIEKSSGFGKSLEIEEK